MNVHTTTFGLTNMVPFSTKELPEPRNVRRLHLNARLYTLISIILLDDLQ